MKKAPFIWRQHWFAPLLLVPFLVMLSIHRIFGLSSAMSVNPLPGERFWPMYNPAMVVAFYAGVVSYLVNTFSLVDRGRLWVVIKCSGLVIFWIWALLVLK